MSAVDTPSSPVVVVEADRFVGRRWLVLGVAAAAALAAVWFIVSTDGLLTASSFKSILAASAVVGVLALGQTLIMLSGSFVSLSLGTLTAVSAMVFLFTLEHGVVVAIILTLLFAMVVNAVQGVAIGGAEADPILLTLAAGGLLAAATAIISGGDERGPGCRLAVGRLPVRAGRRPPRLRLGVLWRDGGRGRAAAVDALRRSDVPGRRQSPGGTGGWSARDHDGRGGLHRVGAVRRGRRHPDRRVPGFRRRWVTRVR